MREITHRGGLDELAHAHLPRVCTQIFTHCMHHHCNTLTMRVRDYRICPLETVPGTLWPARFHVPIAWLGDDRFMWKATLNAYDGDLYRTGRHQAGRPGRRRRGPRLVVERV